MANSIFTSEEMRKFYNNIIKRNELEIKKLKEDMLQDLLNAKVKRRAIAELELQNRELKE